MGPPANSLQRLLEFQKGCELLLWELVCGVFFAFCYRERSFPSGSLLAEHREPLPGHQAFNLSSPLVNLHHGETSAVNDSQESSEQGSSASQVTAALY